MAPRTRGKGRTTSTKGPSRGLTPQVYKGLNEGRYKQKGSGGNVLFWKENQTVPCQFLVEPSEFREYDVHQFREGRDNWQTVPCSGDDCELCEDEDEDIAKTRYQFAAPIYNHSQKKVQILRGGKDLAGKIMLRFKRKPALFLKRVWDITPMPGQFRTYDIDLAEEAPVRTAKLESPDIDKWLVDQMEDYFGKEAAEAKSSKGKGSRRSALDADDEDEADEDEEDADDEDESDDEDGESYTEADLKKMSVGDLRETAEELEIDTEGMKKADLIDAILEAQGEDESDEDEDEDSDEEDDDESEDEEDEDEEDEDDEDEEEEETPAPRGRRAAKATPAKKTTAKRAPAKKATAAKKAPAARGRR